MPIKVLVVDDSRTVHAIYSTIINEVPEFELVGCALDPYEARTMIKEKNPDVITLDLEMPKMDGLTFLKNLMRLNPLPVIVVSSLTSNNAKITIECLEEGAVDFIPKLTANSVGDLEVFSKELVDKITLASKVKIENTKLQHAVPADITGDSVISDSIVGIGASTGGVQAIELLLECLPEKFPPIVITQHIPPKFSKCMAQRLDKSLPLTINEAEDGMPIKANNVYIGQGGMHFAVKRAASGLVCKVFHDELVSGHRPSVDVLFDSLSLLNQIKVMGVMLTGMGSDGANGMLKMKNAGAITIAQDQESSVVWGMPSSAIKLDAVDHVVTLHDIGKKMVQLLNR